MLEPQIEVMNSYMYIHTCTVAVFAIKMGSSLLWATIPINLRARMLEPLIELLNSYIYCCSLCH